MKKTEKILVLLVVMSLILKFTSVSGGSFLTLIFLLLLAAFYYVLGFAVINDISFSEIFRKTPYKTAGWKRIVGAVVTGLTLSTICVGVLYKAFLFSGADNLLFSGLISAAIVASIAAIRFARSKSVYYNRVFWRLGVYGAVGVIMLFV